jgi:hypothetical protein
VPPSEQSDRHAVGAAPNEMLLDAQRSLLPRSISSARISEMIRERHGFHRHPWLRSRLEQWRAFQWRA